MVLGKTVKMKIDFFLKERGSIFGEKCRVHGKKVLELP